MALLPFIDEERLLAATDALQDQLTDEEKRRNSMRTDVIYVHNSHPLAPMVSSGTCCCCGLCLR